MCQPPGSAILIGDEEKTLASKLYVDKETLRILKREFQDPDKAQFTEEYPVVECDVDIPADTFKVPETNDK